MQEELNLAKKQFNELKSKISQSSVMKDANPSREVPQMQYSTYQSSVHKDFGET